MKLKNIFLAAAILFICVSANAQTSAVQFPFSFHVFDEDTNLDLAEYELVLTEDGKPVKTIVTNEKGIVKYIFKIDKQYSIQVKSKNDYIGKTIFIDTRNINLSDWKYKKFETFSLEYDIHIKLFKQSDLRCQNFEFLKQTPVIFLKYDSNKKDILDVASDDIISQIKKERKHKCKTITQYLDVKF